MYSDDFDTFVLWLVLKQMMCGLYVFLEQKFLSVFLGHYVDEERKVYKLAKALYGLRQSPRAWNLKLNNTLKNMDFQRCMQENVYRKVSNG